MYYNIIKRSLNNSGYNSERETVTVTLTGTGTVTVTVTAVATAIIKANLGR